MHSNHKHSKHMPNVLQLSQCEGPTANACPRLPMPCSATLEKASSAIFWATFQPYSTSVAPAAAENVLEKGISTATSTHAHTRGVRARSHPHLPDPKASQPPARHFVRSNAHTRPPQHLNRAPKAGLAKSRSRTSEMPAGTLRPQLCPGPVQSNR